jgi:multidrug efflux pump subunit AcrB
MSTNQPTDPNQQPTWQPPLVPAPPAPEPARKNWFARHKILTTLLGLVAVVVLFAALNGGGGSTAPGTSSPVAASEQADAGAPADRTAKVGEKVRDGQFEFTVTKVQKGVTSVGNEYLNQKAQGQYVLAGVTVTNIGDKPQLLGDSSQKVRDAKGREFSADSTAGIYLEDNKVFLNEINPGNSVKGTLVFDMPKGSEPASIELHDSPFSGGVTVQLG